MQTLLEKMESINSKKSFVEFLYLLVEDLTKDNNSWENKTLDKYLESMAGWVEDMDGYYQNRNEPVPSNVNWRVFADILMASKIYE